MNEEEDGKKYPTDTPMPIAKKIHSVKYLSKKLNFFLSFAGAQFFADIIILINISFLSIPSTVLT
jgi:hypothetical protein